ncbi:DNA cytosine methyltransferase [Pseudomonas capsici]|uniref:DNA cytosine methyltransferase n=1 Tax=Pseudomonas capsici TaxID=2810614 RepID=UPI0021F10ED5|nr:DNA cytosine methyltransferase [Pseudomonas capsici]MCV4342254.1 DNA cytosine methyltransferase [Pseudomonas capsici]
MQAVDIFSGAGGMSMGATLSNIDVKYAIESDPHAAATYSANHDNTIVLNQDIRKVKITDMSDIAPNEPVILFGGPPCQGFSTSNQKTRTSKNENNWLFLEYMRFVKELEPEWVVFENVKGLKETEGGIFLKNIQESFKKLKYKTSTFILNATDYGVPQRRERLFVIGSKKGKSITEPLKTSTSLVTVDDAILDLPILENGANIHTLPYRTPPHSEFARLMRGNLKACSNHLITRNSEHILSRYPHVPQGGNWEDIPNELMLNYADKSRCHTGIYHRLYPDKPSIVVGNFRKNMLIHPWHHRGLSVREAARLQSFPDHYEFLGSIGFQQQQVGNAVPPLLAKAVFQHILMTI